MVNSD